MEEAAQNIELVGLYNFKVDAKGRITLPSKYRRLIPTNDLVVTKNPKDECLYVFTADTFNNWINELFEGKFGKFNPANRTHVALRRKLKARAFEVQIDSAGRIVLPADQREDVEIKKDVVIVGNTGHFEVWDAKRYEQADEDIDLSLLFEEM